MKAALICPVPDLEKYVDRGATHHLLLAHLFGIPGYVDFYRQRSELFADYITVDNGAKENMVGSTLKRTLEFGEMVHADEVVLADVRYQCRATIEAGRHSLKWLATEEGCLQYLEAGAPKIMLVPQGANKKQWIYCLKALLHLVSQSRYGPRLPTIGVAYHYEHLYSDGLTNLINWIDPALDVHLLGWTRRLTCLQELATLYPRIRSVDSSRPFVYGKAGLPASNMNPYPGRDKLFFEESIPDEREAQVRENIALFRAYAGDDGEV